MPNYLSFHILQLAKLKMLSFYYDCLDKWCLRKDFEMCEMDTDSAYFAISRPRFEDIILPEFLPEYLKQTEESCHLEDLDPDKCWFPRACCRQHIAHDKRTPGLFKEEWSGDAMVSLCSKTCLPRQ